MWVGCFTIGGRSFWSVRKKTIEQRCCGAQCVDSWARQLNNLPLIHAASLFTWITSTLTTQIPAPMWNKRIIRLSMLDTWLKITAGFQSSFHLSDTYGMVCRKPATYLLSGLSNASLKCVTTDIPILLPCALRCCSLRNHWLYPNTYTSVLNSMQKYILYYVKCLN